MSTPVIRVDNVNGEDVLERIELGPDIRRALLAARDESGPVVYVLRSSDFAALAECADLIVDRGAKHDAKPLKDLLLGKGRVPYIRARYNTTGKLIQSARALLEHAREQGDHNLFLIGIDDELFAELSHRARSAPLRAERKEPDAIPDPPVGEARPRARRHEPRARRRNPRPDELIRRLQERPVPETVVRTFLGDEVEVRLVRQLLVRAAERDAPVLILGDTGTGKEVVARLIHRHSRRRPFTFMAVNCGAIPVELFEAELFGYEKGSHTTAFTDKVGLWKMADRGTLFLDEIADLAPHHQVKVLRALDIGEFLPIGAVKPVKVDARVIAATNRDLFAMMRAGQFREDLYYRLRGFMIRTPPLREHSADIPALAQALWQEVTGGAARELRPDVVRVLEEHGWPGNVRELKMFLRSLWSLFPVPDVGVEQLQAVFDFERYVVGTSEPLEEPGDLQSYRLHCLRHLRRVDEVLHATCVALRGVSPAEVRDRATLTALHAATVDRVDELEVLCAQRLLFHGEDTLDVIERLKEKLLDFAGELLDDPERALAYWRNRLEPDFASALSVIFHEVERVVRSG